MRKAELAGDCFLGLRQLHGIPRQVLSDALAFHELVGLDVDEVGHFVLQGGAIDLDLEALELDGVGARR